MNTFNWLNNAYEHSAECHPEECCGLILSIKDETVYWPCKNIAKHYKDKSFVIDPLDYAAGEDQGEVVGICHSHPDGSLIFSRNDRLACKFIDLPFFLVDHINKKHSALFPHEVNDET
mgnify:FL=1|tara:strand:+ start:2650 stop:3003 length:354 start_codon:yes stop_codon:yes gene_type:complete